VSDTGVVAAMATYNQRRILTKVAFVFKFREHIMLKLYIVFHRYPPAKNIEQMLNRRSIYVRIACYSTDKCDRQKVSAATAMLIAFSMFVGKVPISNRALGLL
jgi:hypothetical protein